MYIPQRGRDGSSALSRFSFVALPAGTTTATFTLPAGTHEITFKAVDVNNPGVCTFSSVVAGVTTTVLTLLASAGPIWGLTGRALFTTQGGGFNVNVTANTASVTIAHLSN